MLKTKGSPQKTRNKEQLTADRRDAAITYEAHKLRLQGEKSRRLASIRQDREARHRRISNDFAGREEAANNIKPAFE